MLKLKPFKNSELAKMGLHIIFIVRWQELVFITRFSSLATRNLGSWVQAALDPHDFHGNVLGQDTSEPQPA